MCRTTTTAQRRSFGSDAAKVVRASTPPAEAPTTATRTPAASPSPRPVLTAGATRARKVWDPRGATLPAGPRARDARGRPVAKKPRRRPPDPGPPTGQGGRAALLDGRLGGDGGLAVDLARHEHEALELGHQDTVLVEDARVDLDRAAVGLGLGLALLEDLGLDEQRVAVEDGRRVRE